MLGIRRSKSDRHGGPEHRYWVRTIAEHVRNQGYKVTEEVPLGGGKTIDIVGVRDGSKIAFEIETGKSDIESNIKKVASAGIKVLYIVPTSPGIVRKAEASAAGYHGVKVLSAGEVMARKTW